MDDVYKPFGYLAAIGFLLWTVAALVGLLDALFDLYRFLNVDIVERVLFYVGIPCVAVGAGITLLLGILAGIGDIGSYVAKRSEQKVAEISALRMIAARPSTEIVMGDVYRDIKDSSIVNRSTLTHAMNQIANHDSDLAAALGKIGSAVHESGNKEAGEFFDQFTEELGKGEPRKSILRICWNGIEQALPTIKAIAEATGAIGKLL